MKIKSDCHSSEQANLSRSGEPLYPPLIAKIISELAAVDAVFAVDVGESTVWVARCVEMSGQRRMLGSFNHGSMGCALPIALGAAALNPARESWVICGDGAFVMSMPDLITATRFGWPVKIVVFNNSELGFVKMENEVSGFPLDPAVTGLVNPDFVELARACGVHGITIEHAHDIEAGVREALANPGPVLINAIVSCGELTLPAKPGLKQTQEGLLGHKDDHRQWKIWKREFEAMLGG